VSQEQAVHRFWSKSGISALRKRDRPKFKAFYKKKGLKNGNLRILGGIFFKKVGLSH